MIIVSKIENKFLKQSYNMTLWRLPNQHGEVSVMYIYDADCHINVSHSVCNEWTGCRLDCLSS